MDHSVLKLDDGNNLAYHRTPGAAPGIVFLGGLNSNMDGTKALHLERVFTERGRFFLRFDYTGHGKSSGEYDEGTIGRWTSDAENALLTLTSGPQILVGSSMGGWISLLLAKRHPRRVGGLVGIAAAPDFTERIWNEDLNSDMRELLRSEGRVELPSDYGEAPLVITRRLIEEGTDNFVLNSGLQLPYPARFLHGTNDTDVPIPVVLRIMEVASGPDILLTIVKGADHRFSSARCLNMIVDAIESLPVDRHLAP